MTAATSKCSRAVTINYLIPFICDSEEDPFENNTMRRKLLERTYFTSDRMIQIWFRVVQTSNLFGRLTNIQ